MTTLSLSISLAEVDTRAAEAPIPRFRYREAVVKPPGSTRAREP